jgi:hypothetical protein
MMVVSCCDILSKAWIKYEEDKARFMWPRNQSDCKRLEKLLAVLWRNKNSVSEK